ncbi:uncharacterized protein LOC135125691 [Zophobas morio]|uniref:uncharacterized protein LOC135125691 n=1 Tax=Zophobas morio TaxID=2755281 RepID=UPI00308331E7
MASNIDYEYLDVEDISIAVSSYGTYYMVFSFLRQQHQIALILRNLSTFHKFGKPPDFDDLNRRLNIIAKILTAFEFGIVAAFKIARIAKKSECKETLAKLGLKRHYCGLGSPAWTPFDVDFFPVFEIFLLYEFIFALVHSKNCSQISFHLLEITYHVTLRIEHLKALIVRCFNSNSQTVFRKQLSHCIAYHNEILNLTLDIDATFSTIMFGHFALTGAVCACLEKQIIDGHNAFTGFCHFVGWITALFIVCLGGQRVINASESVADALWTSKWYKADFKLQKSVLIMLVRAQRNSNIKAGPFGILCYPFFVSVLKTSYSILCLLTS